MTAQHSLGSWPQAPLDKLVGHVLQTCPKLRSTFLAEMGSQIHAATVRAEFSTVTIPDEALCFLDPSILSCTRIHRVLTILANPVRYTSAVKQIVITDAGLPPLELGNYRTIGLVKLDDDGSSSDDFGDGERLALMPIPTRLLKELLSQCSNLEMFIWRSTNPPPDGICEILVDSCPRLTDFSFSPDAPLQVVATSLTSGVSPKSRPFVPKWDGPSLPLLTSLPLSKLHITRLSLAGSGALLLLLSHLGEDSLLEDVSLDFVWIDGHLCQKLVEAGQRLKCLTIGTSGTKLTDAGLVALFNGCDSLVEFGLVEAQGRLTRNLWSKVKNVPPNLRKFKIALSETGPHHSWTADHLPSLSGLQIGSLTHLSLQRTLPSLHLLVTGNSLAYDPHIEEVAVMRLIPREIVVAIRNIENLKVLECDWWSWRPEDLKVLSERCTRLEYLKIAFDAPFSKLLTLTAAFTPLTQLHKLSVCVPPQHSRGQVPPVAASDSEIRVIQPLTPAPSPTRHRTALPAVATDFAAQVFCTDDSKYDNSPDPSLPPMIDVKRFVKKCPRLIELEWYGRNARGTWLITRSVTTSKKNTNVVVEYLPPVASTEAKERAGHEQAIQEGILFGRSLAYNVPREDSAWSGERCERLKSERKSLAEKEGRDEAPKRLGKLTISKRSVDKDSSSTSPVTLYTPFSPFMSMSSIPDIGGGHSSPTQPTRPLPSKRTLTSDSTRKSTKNSSGVGCAGSATTSALPSPTSTGKPRFGSAIKPISAVGRGGKVSTGSTNGAGGRKDVSANDVFLWGGSEVNGRVNGAPSGGRGGRGRGQLLSRGRKPRSVSGKPEM